MKNKINLTKEEYYSYLYNTKELGYGQHGSVFLYKNGYVLKLWKEDLNLKTYESYCKNIQSLVNHSYHSLLFPCKLVFCEGKLVGYTMVYFSGKNIEDISLQAHITLLLKAIHRMEIAIKRAANSHIVLDDCNGGNIMYYEKMNIGLAVCTDYDPWEEKNNLSAVDCLSQSMKEVGPTLISSIRNKVPELVPFIQTNGNLKLKTEMLDYGRCLELHKYFTELFQSIEQYTNERLYTLNDVSRVLK